LLSNGSGQNSGAASSGALWFDGMISQKQKGFTLIEMLVVISIIAVLMAVLLPVLGRARSQAISVVCSSNLRQLVLANIGYSTENNGFFVPAASDIWDSSGYHRWHGVRKSLNEAFDPKLGPLAEYLANGKVKECPAATGLVQSSQWNVSFEKGCGGYGYNMTYIGSRLWEKGYNYGQKAAYERTAKMSEVGKSFDTLMFADSAFYQNGKYIIEYSFAEPRFWVSGGRVWTSSSPSPSIHFRHKGRANVGWVDGHVDGRRLVDYSGGNNFYKKCARMKLGWFSPVDNSLFDLK